MKDNIQKEELLNVRLIDAIHVLSTTQSRLVIEHLVGILTIKQFNRQLEDHYRQFMENCRDFMQK